MFVPALIAASLLAVSCGGGGGGSGGSPSTSVGAPSRITSPTTIDLVPANQGAVQRLFVSVSAVGAQGLALNLLFDTGSGGVTMDATKVFPSSIVSSSGFGFAPGQSSLTYNGITVSDVVASVTFTDTVQTGNIGSAQVTFGDDNGSITTVSMPILFYYSITDRAGNPLATPPPQSGIFGVNGVTKEANGALASPFRYVQVAGPDSGFSLGPVGNYPACDVTAGSCSPRPLLTVGVDAALESPFSLFNMICNAELVTGPAGSYSINPGSNGCSPVLADITSINGIALDGTALPDVMFDTGTPGYALGANLTGFVPAEGSVINVSLPAGNAALPVQYSWTVGTTTDTTTLLGGGPTVIGSDFFIGHAFLMDFTNKTIGIH